MSDRKVGKLTLAVDAINEPALKLYYRCGMKLVARKVALMRRLDAVGLAPAFGRGNPGEARG